MRNIKLIKITIKSVSFRKHNIPNFLQSIIPYSVIS